MLKRAGAEYEETFIPGNRDLSELFSNPQEFLAHDFKKPCKEEDVRFLRRFRSLFTSGEDNLVLRGVNLYGEKQWVLIADRYLPDRTINGISQRYSKLCVMFYKVNGIKIDNSGRLETPPKLESIDDIDEEKVALIRPANAPAILNVHRWSLEEDLVLLRAVPMMGHMWAELSARFIPHRDRGHLRKRYQVLERRVKATVQRALKSGDPAVKMGLLFAGETQARQKLQNQKLPPAKSSPAEQQRQSSLAMASSSHPVRDLQSSVRAKQPRAAGSHAVPIPPARASNYVPRQAQLGANGVPQGHGDESRAAFEKLASDNGDWSQMSKMKELMENEEEAEVIGALASRLTKAPPRTDHVTQGAPRRQSLGIMADVLERANQNSNDRKQGTKRKNLLPTTRGSKRIATPPAAKQSELKPGDDNGTPSRSKRYNTRGKKASPHPKSPAAEFLFAAADASNLDGLNFANMESRAGVEASKPK